MARKPPGRKAKTKARSLPRAGKKADSKPEKPVSGGREKAAQAAPLPPAQPPPASQPQAPTGLTYPEYVFGRPSELTPQRHQVIVDARRTGLSEAVCAELAGISPSCLTKWKTRGQKEGVGPYYDFFNALRLAGPQFKLANMLVITEARKRDWRAAKALLEMTYPEEFSRRHIKVAGDRDDPTPIAHQEVPMSPEEIKARALRARQILDEAAMESRERLNIANAAADAVEAGEDEEDEQA